VKGDRFLERPDYPLPGGTFRVFPTQHLTTQTSQNGGFRFKGDGVCGRARGLRLKGGNVATDRPRSFPKSQTTGSDESSEEHPLRVEFLGAEAGESG
jgi:hypothetical protein